MLQCGVSLEAGSIPSFLLDGIWGVPAPPLGADRTEGLFGGDTPCWKQLQSSSITHPAHQTPRQFLTGSIPITKLHI